MIDPLDRAAASIGAVPPMPTSLPERLSAAITAERARLFRRKKMLRRLSLVAVLVVVGGSAVAFWPGTSAAQALAAALQKSRATKGYKLVAQRTILASVSPATTFWSFEDSLRQEKGEVVTITNYKLGVKLTYDKAAKTFTRSLLTPRDAEERALGDWSLPIVPEAFQKTWGVKRLPGKSKYDGHAVDVYSSMKNDKTRFYGDGTIFYVDSESGLVRGFTSADGVEEIQRTITYFDTPPDTKLFDLTVPPGYKLVDPAKPEPKADEHYLAAITRLQRLERVRFAARYIGIPGPVSRDTPRVYNFTVTFNGQNETRVDVAALPGMPGLKLGEQTIGETYLAVTTPAKAAITGEIETQLNGPHKGSSAMRYQIPPVGELHIDHVTRKASPTQKLAAPWGKPREYFAGLAAAPAEFVGLDRVAGRVCDIYKLPATRPTMDTLVWVAREIELPVRVTIPMNEQLDFVLEDFDYTPDIPPNFFDLKPLPGYDWADAK